MNETTKEDYISFRSLVNLEYWIQRYQTAGQNSGFNPRTLERNGYVILDFVNQVRTWKEMERRSAHA